MHYGAPPRIVETRVFSVLPAPLRNRRSTDEVAGGRWQGGAPMDSLLEGPCFDPAGNLFLVDVPNGRILRVTPGGDWSVVVDYDGEPNGMRRLADGTFVIADYKNGLMRLDTARGNVTPLATRFRSERFKGPNDVIVAKSGDIYFTDQGQSGLHAPDGRVFRLRRDGQLDCLLSNGPSPNGLVLSADEKILFVAMTRDNAVWRLPLLSDGTTTKVGRFTQYHGAGGPDGMALDAEGNMFVAHASLGRVFVHDRHGDLVALITSCRERMITNLAFGGPANKTIYITESETGTILLADWHCAGA